MKLFRHLIDPQNWGSGFYASVFLGLLAVNLFSPKGIVHGLIMKQQKDRLQDKINLAKEELGRLQIQRRHFNSSDVAKLRAIREELGLLKNDEIAIEFTDSK